MLQSFQAAENKMQWDKFEKILCDTINSSNLIYSHLQTSWHFQKYNNKGHVFDCWKKDTNQQNRTNNFEFIFILLSLHGYDL